MPEPVRDSGGPTPEAVAGRVGPAYAMQTEPRGWTKDEAEIDPVRETDVGHKPEQTRLRGRGCCGRQCFRHIRNRLAG